MADTTVVDAPRAAPPQVDPAVRIPDSVARATAAANAFYTPPPADPNAPPQPDTAAVTTAPKADTTPAAPQTHQERSERDFKAMQGRLAKADKDKQELTRALQAANSRAQQATVTSPAPQRAERLITPQEESDYGREFLTVVKKAAKEDFAPVVAALQGQIQGLQGQIVAERQGALFGLLDAQMPNWRLINKAPQFLSWLALPDAYSGAIRQSLLTEAFKSGDASRVLRFFQGFINDEAAATGSTETTQTNTPQGAPQHSPAAQRQAAVDLGTLVSPGRARTSPDNPSAQAQKPTFTHADIAAFYSRVRQGYYRGREQEKDTLERDIFAAQSDGRVR